MAAPKGNKFAEEQGRPSKYEHSFDKRVFKLALLGLTDAEIADHLEIAESTLNEWKKHHPSFSESLNKGRVDADAKVAVSLYKRATGYSFKSEKIFQFQGKEVRVPYIEKVLPDVGAAKLWLANRQRSKWRDNIDVTTNGKDVNGSDWVSKLPIEKQIELIKLMNDSNGTTED